MNTKESKPSLYTHFQGKHRCVTEKTPRANSDCGPGTIRNYAKIEPCFKLDGVDIPEMHYISRVIIYPQMKVRRGGGGGILESGPSLCRSEISLCTQ